MNIRYKGSFVFRLSLLFVMLMLVLSGSPQDVSAQESTEEPILPTEISDVLATSDPTAPLEATEPANVIPTPDAVETTPEADPLPETTEEPQGTDPVSSETPQEVLPVESVLEDFEETTLDDWSLLNWQIAGDESGHYLQTTSANAQAQPMGFSASNLRLAASTQIATGDMLIVSFGTQSDPYRMIFNSSGTSRLYRGEQVLDGGISPLEATEMPVWFDFEIVLVGQTIVVSVNQIPVIVFTDQQLSESGSVIFSSGAEQSGETRLDNVAISIADPALTLIPTLPAPEPTTTVDLTPIAPATENPGMEPEVTVEPEATAEVTVEPEATAEDTVEPEATAEVAVEPEATAEPETGIEKLATELQVLIERASADPATAQDWFRGYGYIVDTSGRIGLSVEIVPDADLTALTDYITGLGGTVLNSDGQQLNTLLPLHAIVPLTSHPSVTHIQRLQSATSTGPTRSTANTPAGTVYTSGVDTLAFLDWHEQGITGSGIRVGIVDLGFAGEISSDEYSCLAERTSNLIDDSHGLGMVEIICDIAPDAQVYTFELIGGYSSLTDVINNARSRGINVLIIAVDLGAHESPGDGTGRSDENSPYDSLELAKSEGMVIIAAAGNNGINALGGSGERVGRYTTLSIDATAGQKATVSIRASAGDLVNISWNDWEPGLGLSDGANIEDFNLTLTKQGGNEITSYTAERTTILDTSGTQLFVSAVDPVDPNLDFCGVTGNAIGNGDCDLILEIERVQGDSPVIMQIQIIPRSVPALFGNPQENQGTNIEITGVSGLSGASVVTGTGTLARPADSPSVLAVGAVCANDLANYPVLPDSSVGPIFGPNGSLPTILSPDLRANVKPDLMSVAPVSTSIFGPVERTDCDGTIAGLDNAGGFSGTSAAAAHIGGLAALLLSNPATEGYFTQDVTGSQRLADYLQRHSADLPVLSPDGFDFIYGAGLTQLGAPNFNSLNVQNIATAPNLLSCSGSTYYVGQGNLEGPWDGTIETPYFTIGQAISQATSGDCIVVMPGEYPSPIVIDTSGLNIYSYNSVSTNAFGGTIIRVGAQYYEPSASPNVLPAYASVIDGASYMKSGAIYLDGADQTIIDGFIFVGSLTVKRHTIDDSNPINPFSYQRNGIYSNFSDLIEIRNNTFGADTSQTIELPGWQQNGNPIIIEGGSGNRVENNLFIGNTGGIFTTGAIRYRYTASLVVTTAGASGSIWFRNNRVQDNTAIEIGGSSSDWASLIHSTQAYVDVVGNEFVGNEASTIISGRTNTETSAQSLRIVSNVFLNNILRTESAGVSAIAQPGPLVQAYFVKDLAFINNSVVRNNLTNSGAYTGQYSAIIGRGDRVGAGIIGAGFLAERTFDFANNLVYFNTMNQGVVVGVGACDSILGGSGSANATRANWWFDSGTTGTICSAAMSNATNRNITSINPTATLLDINTYPNARSGMFGVGSLTLNPITNPLYYGLGIAHPGDPADEEDDFYSIGVDYADLTVFGAGINLASAPFDVDVNGEQRIFNVGNWEVASVNPPNLLTYNVATGGSGGSTYTVDIGAFEFNRLSIVATPYVYNKVTGELVYREDPAPQSYLIINMNPAIQGGFGQITFEILNKPDTFGTHCGVEYTLENKGMFVGTGINSSRIFYCPPRDFYTEDDLIKDPLDVVPDFLSIGYQVSDEAGLVDVGDVYFYLEPEADPALTESIGDDNPSGDEFIVTGNLGSTLRVNLRPFVRFDNFRFSETDNFAFLTGGEFMIQYPFTYTLPVCDINPPVINGAPVWVDQGEGIISIALSNVESGEVTCTYDVTDADSNTMPQILRVRAVSRIPGTPGIYDDSSFAFEYYDVNGNPGGTWQAVEDERAINNTLHRTATLNETTTFGFRGAGFVLHMFGESTLGGFWDMNIYLDGSSTPLGWNEWVLIDDSTRIYQRETDAGEFVCTTNAIRLNSLLEPALSNASVGGYTVSCISYRSSSSVQIVELVNLTSGRRMTVDAFTLMRYASGDLLNGTPGNPLAPGIHYVSDPNIQTVFGPDWIETANGLYAGGIGYVSRAVNPSSLQFNVYGATGVALGTTLETLGAAFTMCVTDTDTLNKVCQTHDTSPELRTPLTYRAHFPIYGLDPFTEYLVEIIDIQTDTLGKMVVDSVMVFSDVDAPLGAIAGETENDEIGSFFFGSAREDTWLLNTADTLSSNRTLTSIRAGHPFVGPLIAFQVSGATDTVFWTYQYRSPSQGVMVCVDRGAMVGTTTADSHGNCLLVNLVTGDATPILANGTLDTGSTRNIAVTQGTIAIHEGDFRGASWGPATTHTIEIFSVRYGGFSMDKVTTIDPALPLVAGRYEEYASSMLYDTPASPAEVAGIAYLSPDGTSLAAINETLSTITTSYPATGFTLLRGAGAARDFGGGVMYTREVGSIITFRFTGTGFAPHFRMGSTSEAVKICYLAGSQTALDTLATGNCQTYDNQSTRLYYNAPRPVMGLANGIYTVALQFLGDNFSPNNNFTVGEQMWFDGVRIYDTDILSLTPLAAGVTYEPSYVNRLAANQFAYFGNGWVSLSGISARLYSGQNFDYIPRGDVGATLAFRVANSSGVELIRNLSRAYTPVQVCAVDETSGARACSTISNDGTGYQNIIPVYFNEAQSTGNYRVTVTTLDGTPFYFDAVRPIGAYAPLTAGIYEESSTGLIYSYNSQNLIANGTMEEAGYWASIGSATQNQTSLRYVGTFGRQVNAPLNGTGIESTSFQLTLGERYTFIARVRIDGVAPGQVSTTISPAIPAFGTIVTTELNKWVTIRSDFVAPATGSYNIQFTGTPNLVSGMRFYIDDVQLISGSNWIVEYNTRYSGRYAMTSKAHGSEVMFGFTGTGFSLGLITGLHAGETQICWQPYTPPTLPASDSVVAYGLANDTCITYANETAAISTTIQRVIAGLANGSYAVVVRDMEDGSNTTATLFPNPRLATYAIGTMKLDYVRILNETLPAAVPAGIFGDETLDSSGTRSQLSLQPANSWARISGRLATRFSNQSYVTVVDTTGFQSRVQAGPVAILPLNAGGAQATVILDIQVASRIYSNQLLACVGPVSGTINRQGSSFQITSDNCVILPDMTTSRFVTINQDNLPAMANPGTNPLILQALTPGAFQIDGYQVIYGSTLQPGFYEESIGTNILVPTGNWTYENNGAYSGSRALVLSNVGGVNPTGELTFSFTGTGFSMVTAYLSTGGSVEVTVTGTVNPDPVVADTRIIGAAYGSAVSVTGLPQDTYTVTISVTNDLNEKVVVDAIRIYGELQQLGSLYDDDQETAGGVPYITYGPNATSWTTLTGRLALGALNETLHQTRAYGAVASFRIQNTAVGITIYFNRAKTTTPAVTVCFRDVVTGALDNGTCQNVNLVGVNGRVSVYPSTSGNYTVSITNSGSITGMFTLDAVQVLEQGIYEGIYDAFDLNQRVPTSVSTNANFNAVTNTYELAKDQTIDLEVNGVAFSVLIDALLGSSTSYTLCVETGTLPYDGTCDLVSTHTLPRTGDVPGGRSALTYAGLHNGAGAAQTFTIRITNLSTGLLRIKGLHVLGDSTIARITDTERYENNSPQLQYLPFGSLTELTTRVGQASGLSEHTGRMQGSAAYFEFTGDFDYFEYFRQRSTANGNVEICYGQIGVDTIGDARSGSKCETVNNNGALLYRYGSTMPASGALPDCTVGQGCWVSIRNTAVRSMPVDFVRLANSGTALDAGHYEDTHPSLEYLSGSGISSENWETFADVRASSGTVHRVIVNDADNDLGNNGGPILTFRMQGTGFSIVFTGDFKADAVEICYLEDAGTTTAEDVLSLGRCQQYDNESRILTYGLTRTIMGLPDGQYRVAVRMMADAGSPAYHLITALPLSMQVDAVRIYDGDWTVTNALEANQIYQTNFNARQSANQFLYIGDTWQTFEGNAAARQSGRNYDLIRAAGSGVVFQTLNVDAITLYTDLNRTFSPIRICATPLSGTAPAYSYSGNTICQDYTLEGTGNQRQLTFAFTNFQQTASSRYLVSVMTLSNSQFNLDAIETHSNDAPGNILTAGLYQETNPNLFYDRGYTNLLENGTMEQAAHWYAGGTVPGNVLSSAQYLLLRYQGRASWRVSANTGGGIKSETMVLNAIGDTYTALARVNVQAGSVRLKLVDGNDPNSIIEYRNLTPSTGTTAGRWALLRVDFRLRFSYTNITIQVEALEPGTIFLVDDVGVIRGSNWLSNYSTAFNGGSLYRSLTHGASMNFSFTGTGFQLGTYIDNQSGEMEICYDNDPVFDETNDTTAQSCFTYQQETLRPQALTRTISGLPLGTYHVRVRDLEDGSTVNVRLNPTLPRVATLSVGRLAIDYIRILNDVSVPVVPPGYYDNTAVDEDLNEPYLQLEPSQEWGSFSGTVARTWRGQTYTSVIDSNGRVNLRSAGQSATLFIEVPDDGATVLLYTNPIASTRNSSQVLVCAGNRMSGEITWDGLLFGMSSPATPGDCVLRSMATSNTLAVSGSDLTALSVPSEDPVRVTFTTLTPGDFSVDAFQVIHGNTLTPGIYNDTLPDNLLDFSTLTQGLPNRATICNMRDFWCELKSTLAYGGSRLRTQSYDATLRFNIAGSGFSILTSLTAGANMRICYGQTPSSGGITFPTTAQTLDASGNFIWNNAAQDLSAGGIWCDVVTTNTLATVWNRYNTGRLNPFRGDQYGFAYYGLPYDQYTVEVRMVQQLPTITASSLSVDGVVVFEDHNDLPILYSGFYDNTVARDSISLEPSVYWNELTSRLSPPRGPFNFTELNATNVGAVAQVRAYGNAVTLYQTVTTRGSRDIRVCMPVTDAAIHCTPEASINANDILNQAGLPAYALAVELANFSQNGRTAYFMPVMFYGLGVGEHELIFENRDHGRIFSIDAIEVRD